MKKMFKKDLTQGLDISDTKYRAEDLLAKMFSNVKGDVCVGDIIWFGRDEFSRSYKKPKFDGTYLYRVLIVADSYGSAKQQHTFTFQYLQTATGKKVNSEKHRIKGRNLYNHFCFCENADRPGRKKELEDKHNRGNIARSIRDQRRDDARNW